MQDSIFKSYSKKMVPGKKRNHTQRLSSPYRWVGSGSNQSTRLAARTHKIDMSFSPTDGRERAERQTSPEEEEARKGLICFFLSFSVLSGAQSSSRVKFPAIGARQPQLVSIPRDHYHYRMEITSTNITGRG